MADRDNKIASEIAVNPSDDSTREVLVVDGGCGSHDNEEQREQDADQRLIKGGVVIRDGTFLKAASDSRYFKLNS
jgi:hypothetical protein